MKPQHNTVYYLASFSQRTMEIRGGIFGRVSLGPLPLILFGLAAFLALLTFFLGWFYVDTRAQAYNVDQADPEEGANWTRNNLLRGTIHMEMQPLELESQITPKNIEREVDRFNLEKPSYPRNAGNTGTAMLGIFVLQVVVVLTLVAAAGFYYWNTRSRRDFAPTIRRFAGLYAAFALLTMGYLYFAVPAAAEKDTRVILQEYRPALRNITGDANPGLFRPNVTFWNTWICCPYKSHFKWRDPQTDRESEIGVVVTVKSRPSSGFWIQLADLALVGGGLVLAQRTGQLDPKSTSKSPPGGAPPGPSKVT